jgi:ApaG protein
MYQAVTDGIKVSVTPYFLEDQSSPEENHYVWAYRISIENQGGQTVQLRNRFWQITDAMGQIEEVEGAGVVGEQPVLKPGESFKYTSGAPLSTASGIMVGSYEMEGADGRMFDVAIPAFSLDSPHQPIRLN